MAIVSSCAATKPSVDAPSSEGITPSKGATKTVGMEDTDEKKIEDTIKEEIISQAGKHEFSDEFEKVEKIQELVEGDANKNKVAVMLQMQWNHRAAQPEDLSYDSYRMEYEFKSIDISHDTATANVFVATYINFSMDPSVESQTGGDYTAELKKVENQWRLTEVGYFYSEYSKVYDRFLEEYTVTTTIRL